MSIIVPVFNEAATVTAVIERLRTIDLSAPREIIVVNDGSTDGTRAALDRMSSAPDVEVIHADRNRGKGHAVRLGLTRARGSVIAIQDADLGVNQRDTALTVLDRRWHRSLAHADARAGGVDQADRLVRELARGNVTR